MNRPLWIAGTRIYRDEMLNVMWEFRGVFAEKAAALAACDQRYDFVVPVMLDAAQPIDWDQTEYPLLHNMEVPL